jgi:acetyl esterase/lipase
MLKSILIIKVVGIAFLLSTSCFILLILFSSCDKENNIEEPISSSTDSVVVMSQSTYSIDVEQNIVYGQGLKHTSLNSTSATTIDLKLDIYKPKNSNTKRPCIVLIHGGGFETGDKSDPNIVSQARYFSSRGWVAFSINYRLMADNGTLPKEWVQYGKNKLPSVFIPQFNALYPANRDAKAAIRWVIANAPKYNIDTNYITVGGGSAGAVVANALGITDLGDYTNEVSVNIDPTLATTNLDQSYSIKTILDYWGSDVGVDALFEVYGRHSFDYNDAAILIAHGTEDPTVSFSYAEELRDTYISTGVAYVFYPLVGFGHGAWNATIDGKRLEKLAFDFVVKQQKLKVK